MTTLAVLQNQWGHRAHDPDYPSRLARLEALTPEAYASHVRRCLEWSNCQTYRRLLKAFGDEDFGRIVWTNASRRVAPTSTGRFEHDPAHLAATFAAVRPALVIGFGNVALLGIRQWLATEGIDFERDRVLYVAHPAARYPAIHRDLAEAAETWRRMEAGLG